MAKPTERRTVHCYHCGREIDVGGRAMSMPCPACAKKLSFEDLVISSYKGVRNLETCGRLIVKKKGRVVSQGRVVALGGAEIEGSVTCEYAMISGTISLAKKSEWRGDLIAGGLIVEDGAVIVGGFFSVPEDPLQHLREQSRADADEFDD